MELIINSIYTVDSGVFNLYPNPNNGHFSIDIESSFSDQIKNISIISLSGRLISWDILKEQECYTEYSLSRIPPGVYIVKLVCNGSIMATKQFVKF